MANIKVFQIVGYKNSGKTTIIQEILREGAHQGLKIGTIKHHGHGGGPTVTNIKNDTAKHLLAGAALAAVEGNGEILINRQSKKWSLQELISLYKSLSLHMILIEGYKHEVYPKAVLIRNEEDLSLLEVLSNVQAIISWIPIKETRKIPVFSISNSAYFIKWLLSYHVHFETDVDEN